MAKRYHSDATAAIHETMEALHEVGAIDKQVMRNFDASCLIAAETISPETVKAFRPCETEH